MFCRSLFVFFVLFLLAIVLSVHRWFADSNYPYGIFKLFLIVFIYCEQLIFVDQYLKVDVYILKTLEAFKNAESALNETNREISIQLILDINELEKANAILRKKLALTKAEDDNWKKVLR